MERLQTTRRRDPRERGQAAIEFLLAFTAAVALVAILFQALYFELDVFNRSGRARYELLRQARNDNEPSKKPAMISYEFSGRRLDQMPVRVLYGSSETAALHYGPRRFYMSRGTKAWDPLDGGLTAALDAMLFADHFQESAGVAGDVLGSLSDILGSVGQ